MGEVASSLTSRPGGFDERHGFTPRWWAPRISQDHSTFLALNDEDGTELVRVEIVDAVYPGNYVGITESPEYIKIHLIEVHADHRRRGLGRTTLALLAERYPCRRLVAFSEADAFWESVGWSRHVHRDDSPAAPRHQALFVQPP